MRAQTQRRMPPPKRRKLGKQAFEPRMGRQHQDEEETTEVMRKGNRKTQKKRPHLQRNQEGPRTSENF